ncbi:uncharacterized protein LOC110835126 isoform X2 [Zootermopsis nevadensis]|nr:uncharacterized protein LOC110835126 isoform X2 [Zootermopsis nevadensis]XP_021930736.1 uncharacterized protein LOC110835126 isoform X2 [Zootermopsis nevadensis]XP_021930737.1 uncharacterized protein LOC110835126 isoform X2 [Zootermopsis nevadensis]
MRWFRRPTGDSPRLLSLSPLRCGGDTSDVTEGNTIYRQPSACADLSPHQQHRSRIDLSPVRWQRRRSSSGQQDAAGEGRQASPIASREKRNPLLDRVKNTRLSCFRSDTNVLTVTEPQRAAAAAAEERQGLLKLAAEEGPRFSVSQSNDNVVYYADEAHARHSMYAEMGGDTSKNKSRLTSTSCLSAKIRAMSEKYLRSSTNRFLAKLYRTSPDDGRPSRKARSGSQLRSFSYGALPGLEEFQRRHNPLYHEDEDEDCDSGIIVTDSANSSMMERDKAASLDRREVFRRFGCDLELTDKQRRRQRLYVASPPPPVPPHSEELAPQSPGGGGGREFKVVRLQRSEPAEELGIFIAKTQLSEQGSAGYLVAHVVPGGLADRDGALCVGDEIINVNGRRLRGLTMAGARDALGGGPREVDIVIARTKGQDDSAPSRQAARRKSTMPESSVDYENVLILPSTVDTPAEEQRDYEDLVFKCPSPTNKAIKKRQHFQKNVQHSKVFRRTIASYSGGSGLSEQPADPGTGA